MDSLNLVIVERQVGDAIVQTVSARRLYEFLEVKRDFSNWIKDRVIQCELTENEDYVCSPNLANQSGRGGDRRSIEYNLSTDAAKEIAMMDNREKGKQVRKYFIDQERRAKSSLTLPDFTNPAIAARAFADQYEKRLLAENASRLLAAQVEAQAPAVSFVETVANQGNDVSFNVFAKEIGWKPMDLFKWARANKVLQTVNRNIAYQPLVNSGLFRIVEWVQNGRSGQQTLITGKGRIWLCKRLGITPAKPKPVLTQGVQDADWNDENLA